LAEEATEVSVLAEEATEVSVLAEEATEVSVLAGSEVLIAASVRLEAAELEEMVFSTKTGSVPETGTTASAVIVLGADVDALDDGVGGGGRVPPAASTHIAMVFFFFCSLSSSRSRFRCNARSLLA
jgi:hypothetical protein